MTKENKFEQTPIKELEEKKLAIEERINKLQKDLKAPLDQDLSEQAIELGRRETLTLLIKSEREVLSQINQALLYQKSGGIHELSK